MACETCSNGKLHAVGDEVTAKFTNNNHFITFRGKIVGVTKNYYKVESLDDGVQGWPKGHMFRIATPLAKIHSANNRVM